MRSRPGVYLQYDKIHIEQREREGWDIAPAISLNVGEALDVAYQLLSYVGEIVDSKIIPTTAYFTAARNLLDLKMKLDEAIRAGAFVQAHPWKWPLPGVQVDIPTEKHRGAFAAKRKHDFHTGVDLYCDRGQKVTAVEKGKVVAIIDFTGPAAESPWWNPTKAVMVEGPTGVVLYGELTPAVLLGDFVRPGATIGHVEQVLKKDKGLPMTMLHLELYRRGTTEAVWWKLEQDWKGWPEGLFDPTPFLQAAEGRCSAQGRPAPAGSDCPGSCRARR